MVLFLMFLIISSIRPDLWIMRLDTINPVKYSVRIIYELTSQSGISFLILFLRFIS